MKLTGYTAAEVDHFVALFAKLMRQEMKVACDLAADDVKLNSLTADGVIYTAMDSLATIVTQWGKSVTATLMPFLEKVFVDAGQRVVTPLGDVSPVKTTNALASMENLVTSFSNDMWETAKNELIIGSQDGESIAQLAARVENVANIKAKKAHVIAQTTVIAAVNGGEWRQMLEAASAFDLVTMKEWVSTHDSHTRPSHHLADGQKQPLTEPFVVGDGLLQYPGDPGGPPEEIISCRCTTVYDVDADEPITASQTSLEPLFDADAIVNNGQKIAESLTAAFNEAEHPRGKDGKFIKKGVGLPTNAFNILVKVKSKEYVWSDLSGKSKKDFLSGVMEITPAQWSNLKDEDQKRIEKLTSDALDEGEPGSGKAVSHLEDLSGEEIFGNDEDEQHPDLFDPNTPLPGGAASSGVEKHITEAADKGFITQQQKSNLLDELALGEISEDEAKQKLMTAMSPSAATPSATPGLTTGSSKPVKITHGLIHAKHSPGTVIVQGDDGSTITWNGTEYDLKDGETGTSQIVKKSKLYAKLNSGYYKDVKWHTPGKQETAVSHATPLDAAPTPVPVPHPVSTTPWSPVSGLGTSSIDDALDEAFGPLNTGLAPAPTVSSPSTSTVAKQVDLTGWKKIGGQGGSNLGGLYQAPNGEKFYVKSLKSEAHAKNEVLAAALYNAAGVNVPNVQHGANHPDGWKNVIVSPIVPNAVSAKSKLNVPGQFRTDAQSGFAVDAWLANYDTVGLTYDNIVDANGKPWRIDVGGSLLYRAQGGKKTDWGDDPTSSLTGLKNPSKNPQATSLFGSMTNAEEKESAKKLLGITDAQIDQLVKDAGLPDSMAKTLKVRRNAIIAKYGLDANNNSTSNAVTPPAVSPIVVPEMNIVDTSVIDVPKTKKVSTNGVIMKWASTDPSSNKKIFAVGKESNGDVFSVMTSGSPSYIAVSQPNSTTSVWQHLTPLEFEQFASEHGISEWTVSNKVKSTAPSAPVAPSTPTASVTTSSVQLALDNAYIDGLISEAQHIDLQNQFDAGDVLGVLNTLDSLPNGSSSTPSAPLATPTVTAADVSSSKKYQFYGHFKAEKVSPAWSGAKIYKSMHVAKQKMSGDSQIAALSDAEMLKMLDEQHNVLKGGDATGSPYGDKVKEWLKTPNGQKAFKELNPAIATPSPSVAKKITKATKLTSGSYNVTQTSSDVLGEHDISSIDATKKAKLYTAFKAAGEGAYLKSSPQDIFYTATQTAKSNPGVSPLQILKIVDEEGAKKFGVSNEHLFEKKITEWAATPTGSKKIVTTYNDALLSGTGVAAKKVAKKVGGGYTTGYAHAASTSLADKVHSVDQGVPAWNANDTTSYPIISTSEAASLWKQMQSTHGNMTETQKKSLKHYTSNPGYVAMNRYLRGEIGASAATHAHVKNAQDGMRPTTKAITLNRGNGWFKGWENFAAIKAKEGTEFKQEAFFSASVGGKAAFGFKPIRMTIEAPEGTPMAYVKAFSNYGGENEMLLAADLSYQIISVTQSGGHVNVHMRVIAKGTGG